MPLRVFVVKALSPQRTPRYTNQYVFPHSAAASSQPNRDFKRRGAQSPCFARPSPCYLPAIAKLSPCYDPVPRAQPFLPNLLLFKGIFLQNRSRDRRFSLFSACYQGVSGRSGYEAPLLPGLTAPRGRPKRSKTSVRPASQSENHSCCLPSSPRIAVRGSTTSLAARSVGDATVERELLAS